MGTCHVPIFAPYPNRVPLGDRPKDVRDCNFLRVLKEHTTSCSFFDSYVFIDTPECLTGPRCWKLKNLFHNGLKYSKYDIYDVHV